MHILSVTTNPHTEMKHIQVLYEFFWKRWISPIGFYLFHDFIDLIHKPVWQSADGV